MKKGSESFTDVILRLSIIASRSGANEKKRGIDKLAELVESSPDFPDYELADNIEKASKEFRKNFRIREARAI
jgi:predicted CopG family antitoxin